MKKVYFTIACLFIWTCYGICQKNDYNYLYRSAPIGSGVSVSYIDSLMDIKIDPFTWNGTLYGSAVLNDNEGNFLGYFNSRNLYDSIGRIAINGDRMAVGYFLNYFFQFLPENEGLGNAGNCAFIPINDSLYYLFYGSAELWAGAPDYAIQFMEQGKKLTSYTDGIFLTKVRLNADNRLYILPEEKQIVLIDDLFQYANLMFCKQANGEDWWLIIPKALDSLASRFEIKSNGEINELEEIKFSNNYWRVRTNSEFDFSPDGRYLARLIHRTNTIFKDILEVFAFNRCDGTLNEIKIDSFDLPEYYTHFGDVKFSPNNQFLYMGFGSLLLQFDMNDPDFMKHPDTIGRYDGFLYNGHHPIFDSFWLLPNRKILVSGNEYTPYLHYIEDPDIKGNSCHFIQRALELPADPLNPPFGLNLSRLPDFIPFRMGPIESPCGTSRIVLADQIPLKIFPNPAVDIFSITCPALIYQVVIYNVNGQKIDDFHIQDIQDHYEFSLTGWSPGVYFVICRDKTGQVIGTKKLIKI
ncbi:MAG TPA: T9SS type A sorting domain-containing protein [Saprospiraceae bacterium]|nr:T9SS type A sorting domain-containing protein [Saprospiraceae bacterium]